MGASYAPAPGLTRTEAGEVIVPIPGHTTAQTAWKSARAYAKGYRGAPIILDFGPDVGYWRVAIGGVRAVSFVELFPSQGATR